jgi:transcription elongation GreA/GreB family factor
MKENLKTKQVLYSKCLEYIDIRFQTVQNTIREIQESLLSETKSSAGDKHETGRAMLQLEREKAGNQLAEINKIKENFFKIDVSKSAKNVGLGSMVYTTNSNYFIAISAGELTVDTIKFFSISPNTPIGLLLMGKQVGDIIAFREQKFIIENVI